MSPIAVATVKRDFGPDTFFATIGKGRKTVSFQKKQTIFTQGDACDAAFYIQKGKVRLTVVSKTGQEATIGVLGDGDFFGEGGLAGHPSV
jgi:CRP/FNR family transcriptional regulator, cyclic AMP receptor protein